MPTAVHDGLSPPPNESNAIVGLFPGLMLHCHMQLVDLNAISCDGS